MLGHDWLQPDVAKLFSKIAANGYRIVYLSARSVEQASITKDYLTSVKQDGINLPQGPIFLNPTILLKAFHLEVIEKNPESFKIACLQIIHNLFPEATNPSPFHAGFGNRVSDIKAYQSVGIPMLLNFSINSKGELRHHGEDQDVQTSTYGNMYLIVDHLFPIM